MTGTRDVALTTTAASQSDGGEGNADTVRRDDAELRRMAWRIRRHAVDMVAKEGFGYLGQALSSAEMAAVLYGRVLRPNHDRIVISPGHYSIVHFAAGAEVGLIDPAELATYGDDGSRLESIGTENTPGLAATCGSLGQGLSVAAGIALAQHLDDTDRQIYVLVSDGEMEEGQLWEAALFSAHHQLGNLTVLLDRNNSQVDGPTEAVTTLAPVAEKWRAFGWTVADVDGHDVRALSDAIEAVRAEPTPGVVIASTWTLSGLADIVADEADGHFLKLTTDQVDRARAACRAGESAAAVVGARSWT